MTKIVRLSFVTLSLLMACQLIVRSQGREYAVEVASLLSKECAVELANGLGARGFESFWIKDQRPEYEGFYRVRVGRFETLGTARNYAESLLDSGLLDSCAITIYDAPLSSIIRASSAEQNRQPADMTSGPIGAYCPIKLPDDNSTREEDLTASITRSRWLISTGQKVPPTAQMEKVTSPLRDVVLLMRAIDKKNWSIKTDVARMISSAGSGVSITEGPPVAVVSQPDLSRDANTEAPMAPVSSPAVAAGTPAVAPVVDYDPLANYGRNGNSGRFAPARVQGTIEMQGGRLMLRLRNTDPNRIFSGTARITLTGDRQNNDIMPMAFNLQPDEEKLIAVNEDSSGYGDWMLMVYDEKRAIQLIRSASFEKTAAFSGPETSNSRTEQYSAQNQADGSGPVSIQPASNGIAAASSSMSAQGGADGSTDTGPESSSPPPQLTVTPKQSAQSVDSVTLELDITTSQPINYIKIVLKAGDYQSEKIAMLTGKLGRVPFLIPARDAVGPFSYQIVDDLGRSLANGLADFRTISK